MIAILTDKPSVGKEIGRIIGATRVRDVYKRQPSYPTKARSRLNPLFSLQCPTPAL